jgi:hypothetical protein
MTSRLEIRESGKAIMASYSIRIIDYLCNKETEGPVMVVMAPSEVVKNLCKQQTLKGPKLV